MNIHWEAEKYKENFSFVHQYGEDVLSLLQKPKGERAFAVDLGCGNGALTEKLTEKGYRVMGVDDSEEMLRAARELHPGIDFQKGNAINFELPQKADVIFSNAVFHWINASEQETMIRNLFCQLKPGGQLVCEFGGKGCAETVHRTLERLFAQRGYQYRRVFYFPSIGEYAPMLENAGFRVEYASLFDRPTPQKGEHGLRSWVEMFVKEPFEGMDGAVKEDILASAEAELKDALCQDGKWIIDYVRIRIRAAKPL